MTEPPAGGAAARAAEEKGGRLAGLSREEKARLFELLRAKKEREPAPAASRIPRRDRAAGPAPLSFAQQRLWFLDRLSPGDATYTIPGGFLIPQWLDRSALHRALVALVERHEVLRTRFVEVEGVPVQLIAPPAEMALPEIDLLALPLPRAKAEMARAGALLARRPFDLATGPVLHLALLRATRELSSIVFMLHHIAGDGWSMDILVAELTALYQGAAGGRPPALPELPIQYADYACWQRAWLSGEVLERQLEIWRRRLAGLAEPLELPGDRPRPALRSALGGNVPIALPAGAAAAFTAVAKAAGATLFMAVLAAYAALLARLAGRRDLVVGTAVANRGRPELQPLIGFFVNTLPLRLAVDGDPPFPELLSRAREVALEAYAHQDVPFDMLVEELGLERGGRGPLVRAMLSLLSADHPSFEVKGQGGPTDDGMGFGTGTAKFDLTLSVDEIGGNLTATLEYSADLFDPPTAVRYAGYFASLLREVGERPERRISELALLAPGERHQLIHEWNDLPGSAPAGMDGDPAPFPAAPALAPRAPAVVRRAARALVRDETGAPAPIGVAGDLATGDRARTLPDGRLEVSRWAANAAASAEIEAALCRHPAVAAAVVEPRAGAAGELVWVAWIETETAEPAADLGPRLRLALAAELPGARVPAAFVLLPALPRTAAGEPDRRALPEPAWPAAAAAAGAGAAAVEIAELLETLEGWSAEEVAALLAEGAEGDGA